MDNKLEKKILSQIKDKIVSDKKSIVTKIWFNPILWVVIASTILFLNAYREEDAINTFVVIVVSLIVGAGVGIISVIQTGEKQWPILKSHINFESVEKRINEINT